MKKKYRSTLQQYMYNFPVFFFNFSFPFFPRVSKIDSFGRMFVIPRFSQFDGVSKQPIWASGLRTPEVLIGISLVYQCPTIANSCYPSVAGCSIQNPDTWYVRRFFINRSPFFQSRLRCDFLIWCLSVYRSDYGNFVLPARVHVCLHLRLSCAWFGLCLSFSSCLSLILPQTPPVFENELHR